MVLSINMRGAIVAFVIKLQYNKWKKGVNDMLFMEITDVRDGLNPFLRQTLSIIQTELHEGRYRRSSKILSVVADALETDVERIYDALVDTTWPRSELPLIDGRGMFGFPVAHPDFSEIKLSDFYLNISNNEIRSDFGEPHSVPIPYVLVNGTIGYSQSISKIPTHNLGEVIDATVALIQNPELETEQILQYIKGPDLLLGGKIENPKELYNIYESGQGLIKVIVTPETINNLFFDTPKDYSLWYGMRVRKICNKDAYRLEVPYHAFLNDGTQARFMSMKDILQAFIDYYKSVNSRTSDEELCLALLKYKEVSSCRMTYSY